MQDHRNHTSHRPAAKMSTIRPLPLPSPMHPPRWSCRVVTNTSVRISRVPWPHHLHRSDTPPCAGEARGKTQPIRYGIGIVPYGHRRRLGPGSYSFVCERIRRTADHLGTPLHCHIAILQRCSHLLPQHRHRAPVSLSSSNGTCSSPRCR